jgi:GNAT superfamily N-acetyltransferase
MAPQPRLIASSLEREQVQDLRRTVLCGELHWQREAVDDGWDADADLALVMDGAKPLATARLIHRLDEWWVDLVAVLPARRGQGLGREVVAFLAAVAKQKGASGLRVLAPKETAPFFQACGFVEEQDAGILRVLSLDFG